MISVCASETDHPVVREFFELFKTPWQFHAAGAPAEVLLCNGCEIPSGEARLTIVFGGNNSVSHLPHETVTGQSAWFRHEGIEIQIFRGALIDLEKISFQRREENDRTVVRVGYNLFSEIRHLLTDGQPEEFAATPTVERHVAFLRKLILDSGLPLVEIPPKPAGHEFIACLTHDVDHVGIRNHKFDHTMFGFLSRATAGSVLDVFRGKKTLGQLATNCFAAAKLPLVHAGLAKDFWYQFDGYTKLENGAPSTYFVIPKKGEAGLDPDGQCRPNRAASYDARDLKDILRGLEKNGKEVAIHGLNAWRDAMAGREEKKIISEIAGVEKSGIRMHWLYFNAQSPVELEKAGFAYDSTCGYNGAIGYRAGTAQVFKPLTTEKLLELPMQIMDTALFFPSYLNLSPKQAREKIRPLIADAVQNGGALTVNWHDRSIAPERLWDGTYRWLLDEFKNRNAWLAKASQAVAWFQKRRDAVFEAKTAGELKIKARCAAGNLPGLRVRIFAPNAGGKFVEKPLGDGEEICLAA